MTPLYIFDLDGTLANIDHRLGLLKVKVEEKMNWDAFFAGIPNDTPNEWVVSLLNLCDERGVILILTARPERTREATEDWLSWHAIPYDALYMRPKGVREDDSELKVKMLEKFLRLHPGLRVEFVVDDRKRVVEAYRKAGYNALQCAEGDF